jgi:hypothetical protein
LTIFKLLIFISPFVSGHMGNQLNVRTGRSYSSEPSHGVADTVYQRFAIYLSFFLSKNNFPGATTLQFAFIGGLSVSLAMLIAPLSNYLSKRFHYKLPMLIGKIVVAEITELLPDFDIFIRDARSVFGTSLCWAVEESVATLFDAGCNVRVWDGRFFAFRHDRGSTDPALSFRSLGSYFCTAASHLEPVVFEKACSCSRMVSQKRISRISSSF